MRFIPNVADKTKFHFVFLFGIEFSRNVADKNLEMLLIWILGDQNIANLD